MWTWPDSGETEAGMKALKSDIRDIKLTETDLAAIRKQEETTRWLCGMSPRTLRKYAGKWVAARGKRVIASDQTFAELAKKLDPSQLKVTVIRLIEKPGTVIYHAIR